MVKKGKPVASSSDEEEELAFKNKIKALTVQSDDESYGAEDDEEIEEPVKAVAKVTPEDKEAADERKKKKRVEQLDKRINKLMKRKERERTIVKEASEIKNKIKRQEVVVRKRLAKQDEKVIERLKKKKVREEQGEAAMPKGKTNTIESMRVADETLIENAEDEDIKGE